MMMITCHCIGFASNDDTAAAPTPTVTTDIITATTKDVVVID